MSMIDLLLTMLMIDYCLFCSHLDLEIKLISLIDIILLTFLSFRVTKGRLGLYFMQKKMPTSPLHMQKPIKQNAAVRLQRTACNLKRRIAIIACELQLLNMNIFDLSETHGADGGQVKEDYGCYDFSLKVGHLMHNEVME